MNKRGAELAIGTLIIIILGVVVLVLLIVGFTTGFDFFFGKFELLPGQDLETIAQSCRLAAQGDLKIDYCSFKEIEIDGEKEFVNCKDERLKSSLEDLKNIDCVAPYTTESYCINKFNGELVSGSCLDDQKKVVINKEVCCYKN